MGFRFRKSFKVAPGVRLNVTSKGVSSVSVGKRGARVTMGKRGTTTTVGIPGTGLSYSATSGRSGKKRNRPQAYALPVYESEHRSVSVLLIIGIILMPYIFAWFTLRQGYSKQARWMSFSWLAFLVFIMIAGR